MIPEKILIEFGAQEKKFSKGKFIFSEESEVLFFYQIKTGIVKMSNFSEDGKEFVQGVFKDGESFGEPPLFDEFPYPANAISEAETILFRLPKDFFFELLKNNFDIHLKFTKTLASRISYKAMQMKEFANFKPEHHILTLIDYFKKKNNFSGDGKYQLTLTRQEIAYLTGLRVETVIRTIKHLERIGELEIRKGKVFR
ncbi:MAG: Crp/Fnr family transcriptional regulator [Bacteroidia bacterium]